MDVLEMRGDHLMEIKAAALKSLTSIIHLDWNPNFPKLNMIIDVTGAASYHGFLPVMVRNCIASLTGGGSNNRGCSRKWTTAENTNPSRYRYDQQNYSLQSLVQNVPSPVYNGHVVVEHLIF